MTALLCRSASFAPTSLNREARTVEVVALSGPAPVLRQTKAPDGSAGPFWEELDARGADMSGFIGGPVLKDHRPQVDSHVGVIESAAVEGDRIVATVRFSAKPAAEEVLVDVAGGLLRGVSLGYSVKTWQRMPPRDGVPVFRALEWRPTELSFVPVPADSGAIVRSSEGDPMTVITTPAEAQPPAPAPLNRAAANQEIRAIARISGLGADFADRMIDAGATTDQARAAAWEAMSTRQAPMVTTAHVIQDHTDPAAIRTRMADAFAARFTRSTMPAHAREFADMPLAVLGAQLANARGARINTNDRAQMVDSLLSRSGAHTTSDFPLLLQDAGNKILLQRYVAAAPSYRRFSAQRAFTDFKPHKFLRIGDFPALQEIREGGEVNYGTMNENRESVTAKELGAAFSIGRKALINDDLQAFADFNAGIAIRCAADENRLVYTLLASDGPTMSDGKALFHTDHGSKAGSGGAIDTATFGAAAVAMFEQTSLDGLKLNIAPALLVTGSAKMIEAKQLVAAITAATTATVNPFSGAAEVITDANVIGNRWMVFGDPAIHPVVVYGYVAGAVGPQIRTEVDFETRALKVAVGLDFACGVIDYRGAYLNPGN